MIDKELLFDILNNDKKMLNTLFKVIEDVMDEEQLVPIRQGFNEMMERRTESVGYLLHSMTSEN